MAITADDFKIETPHAAIIVWNYKDRVGTEQMNDDFDSKGIKSQDLHKVGSVIISTLSTISIQTSKSKGQPDGKFQLVLAPTRNWVSALTAGSWCCILMSNNPISKNDLTSASADKVKMIGKIESVRVDTSRDDTGTLRTTYNVSGVDWGHIFNSQFYIDNLLAADKDKVTMGNAMAVIVQQLMFGSSNTPTMRTVAENLSGLMEIFGSATPFTGTEKLLQRLASTVYTFNIPDKMVNYFKFEDTMLNEIIDIKTGVLTGNDKYKEVGEAIGYINPFSLQGSHRLWQILLDNSNPALNEMFPEMTWKNNSLTLTLFNRIRPFSYKNFGMGTSNKIKSFFQYVKTHNIEPIKVISLNAGTNWRDKFNFIEVRPLSQEFAFFDGWTKQKSQAYDPNAFEREGFRPMILETKQVPALASGALGTDLTSIIDFDQINVWVKLMREWYFNTHRMLDGTLVMQGTTEYIGVGDNIKFDEGLLNPTTNINSKTNKTKKHASVLAHVESVSHSFTISSEGARTYRTTIQFVRGIIVNKDNILLSEVALDQDSTKIPYGESKNTNNTFSASDDSDPDKQKGVW